MSDTNLPTSVFEVLVKHLVDIEEEKEQLLEKFYPDTTKERDEVEDFISNYIHRLEEYISSTKATDATKDSCPFITIRSIVEIEDPEDNEVEKYQIVSPFEAITRSDIENASYLSPMGKALLLKKVKDEVTVKTPMGQFTYIIKSIELPELEVG